MDNESSCTETNMLIETLTVALRETDSENEDESDQYSIFG